MDVGTVEMHPGTEIRTGTDHQSNGDVVDPTVPEVPAAHATAPLPRALVGYTVRVMIATLLLAAIILVASLNADEVRLDVVTDRVDVPLWGIIAASAGAGLLLGWLVPRRRHR